MEVAQRWYKIFINSCYDRIATSSNFELYEVENKDEVENKEYPGTDST